MRWALNQITLRGGSRSMPEDLAGDLGAVRVITPDCRSRVSGDPPMPVMNGYGE